MGRCHSFFTRDMRTQVAVSAILITSALLPVAQVGHTASKPVPGTFIGEHGLRGHVELTFATRRGIGLHLSRYTVTGDLRCEGEPVIPLEYSHMKVTAKTAARVTGKRRTFSYRAATLHIDGRFASPKRIVGTITGRASYCEQAAGFTARIK